MFKVTRPLVFDNEVEGLDYTTAGSCIVVSVRDRIYAVTARHIPDDPNRQYRPSQTLIPFEEGSDRFLPLKEAFVIRTQENDDTDHKDVLLLEIWKDKLDMARWNPDYCFNLSWNDPVVVTDKTQYWISGYPHEINIVDYDAAVLQLQAAHLPGKPTAQNRFIGIDEWQLDPVSGLQSYQGLSGAGAFSFTPVSAGNAHVRLEGMVLKASIESGKALVLQSRLIGNYILKQQES